jgi:hypothetical protein
MFPGLNPRPPPVCAPRPAHSDKGSRHARRPRLRQPDSDPGGNWSEEGLHLSARVGSQGGVLSAPFRRDKAAVCGFRVLGENVGPVSPSPLSDRIFGRLPRALHRCLEDLLADSGESAPGAEWNQILEVFETCLPFIARPPRDCADRGGQLWWRVAPRGRRGIRQ